MRTGAIWLLLGVTRLWLPEPVLFEQVRHTVVVLLVDDQMVLARDDGWEQYADTLVQRAKTGAHQLIPVKLSEPAFSLHGELQNARRSDLLQSDINTRAMSGEPFDSGHVANVVSGVRQRGGVVRDDGRPLQKIVGAEAVREPSRPARRQDMRRAGNVIADRDRRVMAEKDRSGVLHLREDRFGIGGRDVQVLGRQQVRQPASVVSIFREDQRAVVFEALPREIPSWQAGELLREFVLHGGDQRSMPSDEHSRSGTVLGLRD